VNIRGIALVESSKPNSVGCGVSVSEVYYRSALTAARISISLNN